MRKIAQKFTAVFLAAALSGCSAGTAAETTEKPVETTATTVTTTVPVETDKAEEFVVTTTKDTSKKNNEDFDSTKGPEPSVTPPPFFFVETVSSKSITEETFPSIPIIEETTTTNNAIIDENVPHIELLTRPRETDYTEFESIAILWSTLGIKTFGRHVAIYFPSTDYSENPSISIVENWGCFPSAIVSTFENSDSVFNDSFTNLTNSSANDMYSYIDRGIPVMVWVTEGLAKPELVSEYGDSKMYGPKECVVLAGYSDSAVVVWSVLSEKYVTYDRALFEQRFEEMGKMALVFIYEGNS